MVSEKCINIISDLFCSSEWKRPRIKTQAHGDRVSMSIFRFIVKIRPRIIINMSHLQNLWASRGHFFPGLQPKIEFW